MKLTMALPPEPCADWRLARQVGAEGAVFGLLPLFEKDPKLVSYAHLKSLQSALADVDLELSVIEGDPVPLEATRLGLPDRDAEIARYTDVIRMIADLGVQIMCPNFMAGINWTRTHTDIPIRGGALTSAYRHESMQARTIDTRGVALTESMLWDHLFYWLERVLPVAEDCGVKLALHPDDPPLSPVANVPRIVISPEAYEKIFAAFPSSSMGMTFCQGNFCLMDGDLAETAERLCKTGKVFFVHYRDVAGDKYNFQETFHDDGPTDMAAMMRIYLRHLQGVPLRPDHVPTLEGDDNRNYGYTMRGRLFAAGYIRGLIDGIGGG